MLRTGRLAAMAAALAWCAPAFSAPISITTDGQVYSQDFNTLLNTGGPITFVNDSTLSAWYANRAVNGVTTGTPQLAVTDGSDTLGGLKSLGTGSSTERALGALADGGVTEFAYGVRFDNNAGAGIVSVAVQYDGEQWSDRSTTADTLRFYYRIGGTSFDLADVTGRAAWTAVSALNFVSIHNNNAGTALDGNAAGNRSAGINATINLLVPNGSALWLGWFEENDTGADQQMGIDNFSATFTLVPEPGTLVLLSLGAAVATKGRPKRRHGR